MLKIIDGDLFTTNAKYLIHQCNCVTKRAAHLAYDVFKRYPWADVYSCRYNEDAPGNIIIRGNGGDKRYVIALLGQFYPGAPKFPYSKLDGFEARQEYFFQALQKVAEIEDLDSVAFPYGIGCGAAGGNWEVYQHIIEKFSDFVDADVFIYRLQNDR